jgi:hypothetical protein
MDKFYIIQSLKPTDPDLGQSVHDNIKDISTSEFFKVTNKNELLSTLDYIRLDLTTNPDLKAVIHIHCHGNDQGIDIRDDSDKREFVFWEDLRDKFREIYMSTNKKPLLSMCACKGFNVAKLVAHFQPCPYDYITGSFKAIDFDDSINGYSTFYKSLISGKSIIDSINETRQKFPAMDFACFNSTHLFQIATDGYKKLEMTPEKIKSRRDAIEKIIIDHFGFMNEQQKNYLDHAFSDIGTDEHLEKYRSVFFS